MTLPTKAILIVATHPDDECTLSTLWTMRPDVAKVFLWVDQTAPASNSEIVFDGITGIPQPVRWNHGEWKPEPFDEQARADGPFMGSLLNINALRAADPSLPDLRFHSPSCTFTEADGRKVTVWVDWPRGAAIRYALPQAQVTPYAVKAAILDVTLNPGKYGLSEDTSWVDIIASSYYNSTTTGMPTCDTYANPTHYQVNLGVGRYAYPHFSGSKLTSVCQAYPYGTKRIATVSPAVRATGYGTTGSIAYYFSWLYRNTVPLMTTTSGVFSERQAYLVASARSGI